MGWGMEGKGKGRGEKRIVYGGFFLDSKSGAVRVLIGLDLIRDPNANAVNRRLMSLRLHSSSSLSLL